MFFRIYSFLGFIISQDMSLRIYSLLGFIFFQNIFFNLIFYKQSDFSKYILSSLICNYILCINVQYVQFSFFTLMCIGILGANNKNNLSKLKYRCGVLKLTFYYLFFSKKFYINFLKINQAIFSL